MRRYCCPRTYFYPRPPRGGRPALPAKRRWIWSYFYPRPPRGGRLQPGAALFLCVYFYPRPPRGGRRCLNGSVTRWKIFLSTPSARRATLDDLPPRYRAQAISIHALREEGDLQTRRTPARNGKFLSTPSARRATRAFSLLPEKEYDFYPRPPRGGRRRLSGWIVQSPEFLSTPSARRATYFSGRPAFQKRFLSTPSARRATAALRLLHPRRPISIHALREEGDHPALRRHRILRISIHALREEGDAIPPQATGGILIFLSTPSARRAT